MTRPLSQAGRGPVGRGCHRIGQGILAAVLALALAGGRLAADALEAQVLTEAAARDFAGVLELSVDGRRACSAVLIAPDQAVTAAHCVAHVAPQAVLLARSPGLAGGAAGHEVAAIVLPEGYDPEREARQLEDLSSDLALLTLGASVGVAEASPFTPQPWPDPLGAFADILGFQRAGPGAMVRREGCMALGGAAGVVVLNCDVVSGLSGAPVFLQGKPDASPTLVAIVSSRTEGRAYVVSLAPAIAALQARRPKE